MGEAKISAGKRASARAARKIPLAFGHMHDAEEAIRQQAISAIENDAEMMDHVELLEAVMGTLDFFAVREAKDLDQETVQLLGARIFNDLASAYGQMLRGYYQIAAAVQRDVMEVVFLLGMFDRDPKAIKEWRESDHKARRDKFKPVDVRKFLDTYDGFTEGKRGKAYQMFCEYAAHATWAGFTLMRPTGGKVTIGPFFDAKLMKAVLVELVQLAAQAGNNFVSFFGDDKGVEALEVKLHRLEVTSVWAERYFGRKADRDIATLKKTLATIKSQR